MNGPQFTSLHSDHRTDREIFRILDWEFHFTLDACADPDSAKCPRFYSREDNALTKNWVNERVFINPPYGRPLNTWIKKAWLESTQSDRTIVVCLVPARTDAHWWHNYAMKAREIRFIEGRLRFSGAKYNAPFPSVVLVFGKEGH
jgi:phage N-6-adenine-methyltransferase